MIDVANITVRYNGALALSDVSLRIDAGDHFAVLGRNGAGKTTLLRALAGVLAPSAGSVTIAGVDVKPPPSSVARRGLRYVPESWNVFGDMTVRDNLQAAVTRTPRRARRARVAWALETFPILQPLVSRRADRLSGGERQSLAVAAGLMTAPRVLLLDEPSLGLSPKMARSLMQSISLAAADTEMAVVLAEQNAILAASLCRKGCWLETGRIAAVGSMDDITGALRREAEVFDGQSRDETEQG
jgi:branched-chain amino acid transport system ATP-binding protein